MEVRKTKLGSTLPAFNGNSLKAFPTITDLACLSYAVYFQNFKDETTYDISKSKSEEQIEALPNSWKLIATAKSPFFPIGDGYNGSAYYNEDSKHIVVAHRGTSLRSMGCLMTDIIGIGMNREMEQMKSAYKFTKYIVDKFLKCSSSISVTGHSLGGWLSQTSAFFMKYPEFGKNFAEDPKKESHHLHVVVFESPGALNIVESYTIIPRYSDNRYLRAKFLDSLDVTTYLSSPNYFNHSKLHIGSLFMIPNLNSHSMNKIVNFLQFDSFGSLRKVTDWPNSRFYVKNKTIETDKFDMKSMRMSAFNREERDFLENIFNLKTFGVDKENTWEIIFKGKDITQANHVFVDLYKNSTQVRNVFDFFNFFRISDDCQVIHVNDYSEIDLFISLVKYFVKNTAECDLPKLVEKVISDLPKVYKRIYQEIYQGCSRRYLSQIPKIKKLDHFLDIEKFLGSTKSKIYQVVDEHSTIISVAKINKVLKSKEFLFAGKGYIKFNEENSFFLHSDNLTDLKFEKSIFVSILDDIKFILIENNLQSIQPTLKTLIDIVISSAQAIKLIIVTRKKIHLELSEEQFSFNEVPNSDQIISFLDLSDEQQQEISDSEICFQGEIMPLKNLISLEELKSDRELLDSKFLFRYFSQEIISFGNVVPYLSDFEKSYYIDRHFHKVIVTEPEKLSSRLKDEESILVISYEGTEAEDDIRRLFSKVKEVSIFKWTENFEGFIQGEHNVILADRSTSVNYNSLWFHFKPKNINGYWLVFDKESYYWHGTFGRPNEVFEIKHDRTIKYNGSELLQLQRPLIMIADEPGMGKSTILKYFAEKCKDIGRETEKASWVIFINSDNSKEKLNEIETRAVDLSFVLDFLTSLGEFSIPSRSILNYLLKQEGRVTILFDELEEVTSDIQSKVFRIVNELLNHTRAKVYIASRLHLRLSLESNFNNYINTLVPLEHTERIQLLTEFWTNHADFLSLKNNDKHIGIVESYATDFLNKLEQSLNIAQADSFLGVPLQLFMLGTVYLKQVCEFYSEYSEETSTIDSKTEHCNIFHLYQMFVKEKIRISLEDKCKFKDFDTNYSWHNDTLTKGIIKLYQRSSFFFLFPEETEFLKSEMNIQDIQVLLSVGIVSSHKIDINSIHFIHRSFAEYFAADFLVSKLTKPHFKDRVLNFLEKNIFLQNFDKIRFFIDHFISIQPSCDPIFGLCLEWKKEKMRIFETLEDSEHAKVRDLLGRNVLHYAICYGDHESGILSILIQNFHLFEETDVFGYSFISYAVLLPNLGDLICSKFMETTSPDMGITFNLWNILFGIGKIVGELVTKEYENHLDLNWIYLFSGKNVSRLIFTSFPIPLQDFARNANFSKENIESELDNEIKQFFGGSNKEKMAQMIHKGLYKLPIDFSVVLIRGYCESIQPFIRCFCYSKESAIYKEVFEKTITIGGYSHVKVAESLYDYVVFYKSYFEQKKNNEELELKLAKPMLDIMASENFALLKNCIEMFEKGSVIDIDLWMYCKDEKQEMFDIIVASNYATLRRAFNVKRHCKRCSNFLEDFLHFCQELQNEIIETRIVDIIREDVKLFQSHSTFISLYIYDLLRYRVLKSFVNDTLQRYLNWAEPYKKEYSKFFSILNSYPN